MEKAYLGSTSRLLQALSMYLADQQRGTCTLRGIRRRLVLKVEGLARVSKHAEKTTTSCDCGVDGIWVKLYDRDGPLGHKRPASTLLFVF